MTALDMIIEKIVLNNLRYNSSEKILVVADDAKRELAKHFLKAAQTITEYSKLVSMPARKEHGEEPTQEVEKEMLDSDIILIVTSKSLTHTKARIKASEEGAKIASMPDITDEIIQRCVDIDYKAMEMIINKIVDKLRTTKQVRVKTEKGTDITFIVPKIVMDDTGDYSKKGDFGNLPAGEVFFAPVNASGRLVIDGSMLDMKLKEPVEVLIQDNYAVGFGSNRISQELKAKLNKVSQDAFNLAEFGIGTNPKAIITGNILEDEKVLGTVHFAFGNNASFGGKVNVPIHLDGVILKPTVYFDDKIIMKEGKMLL
ncbi:aminopeptidase [Candidatus Woesearchaeota archaeon]|nr:aminopeptidase [Candidatus Woesearchaeota archaeon]